MLLPGEDFAPPEVQKLLFAQGWAENSYSGPRSWTRNGGPQYTWEQAMAIEFANFITLGGK